MPESRRGRRTSPDGQQLCSVDSIHLIVCVAFVEPDNSVSLQMILRRPPNNPVLLLQMSTSVLEGRVLTTVSTPLVHSIVLVPWEWNSMKMDSTVTVSFVSLFVDSAVEQKVRVTM